MRTAIFTTAAARDLDALSASDRKQVESGLYRYAVAGQGDVKPVKGRPGYRLRIGRHRVIFDKDRLTILAIYISKRDAAADRRI